MIKVVISDLAKGKGTRCGVPMMCEPGHFDSALQAASQQADKQADQVS